MSRNRQVEQPSRAALLQQLLALAASLMVNLAIFPLPVLSKDGTISVYSTDKLHTNRDKVFLEGKGSAATVIIEPGRGIGSARIEVESGWNQKIKIDLRGFTRLEHFEVRNEERCIEAALGLPARNIGKWSKGHCLCSRVKSGPDILKMRVHGKNIRLEIPVELVRSDRSQELNISWIDAYR